VRNTGVISREPGWYPFRLIQTFASGKRQANRGHATSWGHVENNIKFIPVAYCTRPGSMNLEGK
jgi:hypothetical protein